MFTPTHEPHCKRIFCGFCGTHLSYWTEEPATEADYLSITLGSLLGEDIHALQELDLLPEEITPEDFGATPANTESTQVADTMDADQPLSQRRTRTGRLGDLDWFEEMIHGSRLGRTRHTRRGMGASADGSAQVSWEVSEYVDGANDDDGDGTQASTNAAGSKRKIGDVGSGDDVPMKQ